MIFVAIGLILILILIGLGIMVFGQTPTNPAAGTTYCATFLNYQSCVAADPETANAVGDCCPQRTNGKPADESSEFFRCVYNQEFCPAE